MPHLTGVLEAAAVVVSAVSGMITAARKRMDIVGTYCLAVVTALGGGTLRDLLIDRRPFFWVSHEEYLLVIVVLCVGLRVQQGFLRARQPLARPGRLRRRDGPGALHADRERASRCRQGMPPFVASLIGVITGTFGGVLRDVVSTRDPGGLSPGRALCGLVVRRGVGLPRLDLDVGASPLLGAALAFVTIVGLRMVSVRFGVRVPDPLWIEKEKTGTTSRF